MKVRKKKNKIQNNVRPPKSSSFPVNIEIPAKLASAKNNQFFIFFFLLCCLQLLEKDYDGHKKGLKFFKNIIFPNFVSKALLTNKVLFFDLHSYRYLHKTI